MNKTTIVMLALAALAVAPTAAAGPEDIPEEVVDCLLNGGEIDLSDDAPDLPPNTPPGVVRLYERVFGHYRC